MEKEGKMITDWLDQNGDPEVEQFIEKNLAITEKVRLALDEIIQEVKSKQKEIQVLKKELQKKSQEAFFKGAKEIFNTCPDFKSISWTQYTPYFNDGDECKFSANIDYPEINEDVDGFNEKSLNPNLVVNQGNWNRNLRTYEGRVEKPNPDYNVSLSKAVDSMSKFLQVFDQDFYKEQFGDHVKVTITPEGVSTEEYEHE
jgi:hypothetical protein